MMSEALKPERSVHKDDLYYALVKFEPWIQDRMPMDFEIVQMVKDHHISMNAKKTFIIMPKTWSSSLEVSAKDTDKEIAMIIKQAILDIEKQKKINYSREKPVSICAKKVVDKDNTWSFSKTIEDIAQSAILTANTFLSDLRKNLAIGPYFQ